VDGPQYEHEPIMPCAHAPDRYCSANIDREFFRSWNCHTDAVITTLARLALGAALIFAGISHFLRSEEFLAQVPPWMPLPEATVAISGVVEILLGLALVLAPQRWRALTGWIVAAFFIIIFPGNIWQFVEARDAFGLDSDATRFIRLLFQPVLVAWALWATGAWSSWRNRPSPGSGAQLAAK
jgi:uncharacterized membrane protein